MRPRILVVLLYPDILNFTFFFIDFLEELGNFKQKKIYTSKCKFFLHFTFYNNRPKITYYQYFRVEIDAY